MERLGVLCSGNVVADVLVRPVDSLPWERTQQVEAIEQHPGGNGCNTSLALAALGVKVRLLSAVGRDAFGDFVLDRLRAGGVDASGVRRVEAPTAATVVLVRADGSRGFLHRMGASAELSLGREEFASELTGFRHYHAASPFVLPSLLNSLAGLLEAARAAGLSTSLDANWDSRGRWLADLGPCLPHTDYLFVNREEARMLTGVDDPGEAARALLGHGARTAAVKLGDQGCLIASVGGAFHVPAFAARSVDTTGAGDCFVGAFLAGLLREEPLESCARFANAAAAPSTERLGAAAGLAPREAVEAWMRGTWAL